MRVLLFDSYDSFTYNLSTAMETLGAVVDVVRCDQVDPAIVLRGYDRVVFGPGPGRPEEAGCLVEAVRCALGRVPLLGVCLGHQALALAMGGHLLVHPPVHGHATPIRHRGEGVFASVPAGAPMTRYHSLVVDPNTLPRGLAVTAWSDDGAIMGLMAAGLDAHGVQFHPESVLSGRPGLTLLAQFLAPRSATWADTDDTSDRAAVPRRAGTAPARADAAETPLRPSLLP